METLLTVIVLIQVVSLVAMGIAICVCMKDKHISPILPYHPTREERELQRRTHEKGMERTAHKVLGG